jgi:hypothetical protein
MGATSAPRENQQRSPPGSSPPPHLPLDSEVVEEPSDPFDAIDRQPNRTEDVVHTDRCSAHAFVEDAGEVRPDRGPEDREGPLPLERCRWPVDRLKASFDRELGEILAHRQVVGDQVGDRDVECVKDPLRAQIQDDDLSIDAPDTSTDLERTHPVVEEVAEQLGPSPTLSARAIPRGQAARPVIPALGLGWVGDRRDRVPWVALMPDTERAR